MRLIAVLVQTEYLLLNSLTYPKYQISIPTSTNVKLLRSATKLFPMILTN